METKLLGTAKAKVKVEEVKKDDKTYHNISIVFEQNGQTYEFPIKNKFDMSNSQYGLWINLCSGKKLNNEKK